MDRLIQHILYRADTIKHPITVLHLNKIYYFTLGYMTQQKDEDTVKTLIKKQTLLCGPYGPYIPKLIQIYERQHTRAINNKGHEYPEFNPYNQTIDKLVRTPEFSLVDMALGHDIYQKNKRRINYNRDYPKITWKDFKRIFNKKEG